MEMPKAMDGRIDKKKTEDIVNKNWSLKLLWTFTRRTLQEMC